MKRLLSVLTVMITLSAVMWGQAGLRMPVVSTGAVVGSLYWTAGVINNGGHAVSITAGSVVLDSSKTDCAAPTFTTCDMLYANSSGTVSLTTTAATAGGSGNTLLAIVETNGSHVATRIVSPLQSGTLSIAALALAPAGTLGVASGGTGLTSGTSGGIPGFTGSTTMTSSAALTANSPVLGGGPGATPAVVAGITSDGVSILTLGVAGTSVGEVDFKNATSGTVKLKPTTGALGTVTATFPAANITVPGVVIDNCGTNNACSITTVSSTAIEVYGHSAALNAASPSLATLTGLPFTSTSSYVCTVSGEGTIASTGVLSVSYLSASSVQITGANGATNIVSYRCTGT